jgi:hypothetical protein
VQAAHGFTAGKPVRHNGTTWVGANATSAANAVVGGLVGAVISADAFLLVTGGRITGLTGLTAGAVHYLSTTGTLTTTAPTSPNQVVPLVHADSATSGVLLALGQGSSSSSETIALLRSKTAHGFVAGEVVRHDGTDWVKADADAGLRASHVVGVVSAAPTADTFVVVTSGKITLASLIPGSRYYLSTTPGAVSTTPPTGHVIPVYDAISGTEAIVAPLAVGRALQLGDNGTGEAGVLRLRSPNASGDAVVIDGALVTASSKQLGIVEIDICDGGTAKKMLVIASAPY